MTVLLSDLLLMGMHNRMAILEDGLANSYKDDTTLSYDPATALIAGSVNELKLYVHTKTFT